MSKKEKNIAHKLNDSVFEAFKKYRSNNIPINGVLLKQIALKISRKLNLHKLKASNGWLDRWRKKYDIKYKTLCGESKSNDDVSAEAFLKRFKKYMLKYNKEDMFNIDETSLYYKKISNKSFILPGENTKFIKRSKNRVTILLGCSMTGEKLIPLIIGKSKTPRSFKNIDLSKLDIMYDYSTKGWMNYIIFKRYLNYLNSKMIHEKRKILLILDNAPSHPNLSFSNIELCFLPKNTTALIQPCDQGIIKAFKNNYNNILTNFIIDSADFSDNIENCIKSINILDISLIVSMAWKKVSKDVIINCFNHMLKYTRNNQTINIKNYLSEETVQNEVENMIEELECDTMDEEDTETSEIYSFDISHINKIFTEHKEFIKKYCPTELLRYCEFRVNLLSNLKKNKGYGRKITDFFIKK
ncbi:Tigger transposable element-derived protein 4 [Dictyocoela muelleri]|nr:Tigger transposable element-derived protein 4 [Dictyocoela muelleri]